MAGTMLRSDVVLAELDGFLDAQSASHPGSSTIILAVASETSSLLPCCSQSLGFKNAQISKLWSATHWKNDACRLYWKDVHLVCVRKYRPNSTYAAYEEVSAITGDKYAYLHELPPTVSPLRRVSSKTVLGAKTPSSVTSNTGTLRTLRSVTSHSKLGVSSPKSPSEEVSPSQKQPKSRTLARPRASEPAVSTRMPQVRSPIITRRRSNTALHAPKVSASPQPPVPTRDTKTARSPPITRPLARKASDSAMALKARPRISIGASRSVSGSAIPTPVRRASVNMLESIVAQGSPSSPIERSLALKASQRRFKATSPTTMVSISIQTESEQNPLMNEFVKLEKEFENSKREHETTLSYIRELGFENHNLRKQNSRIVEEKEILNEEKKILEGTIKELKMINTDLTDESELIIVCKVEKEGKIKQLEEENEKLVTQYTILSNQRKELELNDALDEISRLQVQAAAATMANSPQIPFTPLRTPVTRFKEHLEPATVYKTPYLTPVKQTERNVNINLQGRIVTTPVSRALSPKNTNASARKVRTPMSANAKGQKHGLRFWKRMAKSRMFA